MNRRLLVRVVDDEESVRTALSRLIRVAGYEVEAFETGVAFLEAERRLPCDCVILDLGLPGLSGREVQQALARDCSVPIVVISAQDNPDLMARCIEDGAHACLRKPLRAGALLEAISSAVVSHGT